MPDPKEQFGPERISYKGLADVIAKLVCPFSDRYRERLVDIALFLPEYGVSILNYWANPKFTDPIPWVNVISLCECMLNSPIVWDNESKKGFEGEIWRNVRLAIARLLNISVSNTEKLVPFHLIGNVKELLYKLVDDPDPTPEADRPPDGWFGHNDPITVALNHVRPISLMALIRCAVLMASQENPSKAASIKTYSMEPALREKLLQKLNFHLEPSRAVRSVFGQFIPTLFWLDKVWVIDNLDAIFPWEQDDESIWLFISAWNSYVLNKFHHDIYKIMRPKYTQAIDYLAKGYTTESHLQQASNLAAHLLFDFLFSDNDLDDFIRQRGLLVEFFQRTQPEIRSRAPWALWIICQNYPDKLLEFWPKSKALWEWRTQNHQFPTTLQISMPRYRNFLNYCRLSPLLRQFILFALYWKACCHFYENQKAMTSVGVQQKYS